jgi:hypothetical protein
MERLSKLDLNLQNCGGLLKNNLDYQKRGYFLVPIRLLMLKAKILL